MYFRKISLFIGILSASLFLAQRSKEDLQRQNAELKKQIETINANLAKAKSEARLSISYLNDINKKIALREKVYGNTQKEKRFIEDDIYLRQLEINKYNRELKVLRKNYAEILVKAYKNKGVQNKVTFILSSQDLGQALRRVQYLKQYGEYQDKKAAEISDKAKKIKSTIALREKSKKDKENLLLKQAKDLEVIAQERKEKEILLEDFKKNEARLAAELKQKQAESKRLEGEIRKIIAEEIRIAKAKEEAERKAREEKLRLARIEAEKEKARIEEANRRAREEAERAKRKAEEEERRLAEIARKKAEEERKAIEANNEAKRIAAEKAKMEAAEKAKIAASKAEAARVNAEAVAKKTESEKKAVDERAMASAGAGSSASNSFAENRGRLFAGVVVNVLASGGSKTVMVKHGNYFTIYSNLASTYVSKNQTISAGTNIGEVGLDFDGTYTLDFQVWNQTNPVDPLSWVTS